ncbi:hypothetical protein OG374_01835 [Streptomyces sp. NBC_00040]
MAMKSRYAEPMKPVISDPLMPGTAVTTLFADRARDALFRPTFICYELWVSKVGARIGEVVGCRHCRSCMESGFVAILDYFGERRSSPPPPSYGAAKPVVAAVLPMRSSYFAAKMPLKRIPEHGVIHVSQLIRGIPSAHDQIGENDLPIPLEWH